MVFSSILFVCMFFPAVYLINLLLPRRVSNVFLLAASLFLYAWGEPLYLPLLLGCVAVNYALALWIGRGKYKKLLLALAVLVDLLTLGVFKYAGFAVETVNAVLHTRIAAPGIAMPIGISFFTFQAMSYVIDVYRGTCEVQRSFIDFALYVAFFPQLIAGPIVKYHEIREYLKKRSVTLTASTEGLRRFVAGLGKKVLISNVLAGLADALYGLGGGRLNAPLAWLAAVGYALQIYFDFSGYSDMAIGMGKMFGFAIPENFDHPYVAASLREFWRRWHISLSGWFRDYLYIPLGGNRRGRLRTHLNRLIVFFLTGLWHGASWNFVIWGLGHGALLTLENSGLLPVARLKGKARLLGILYTVFSATCLFVFFRADTLPQAASMLRAMFAGGVAFSAEQLVFLADALTPYAALMLAVGALGATPLPAVAMARFQRLGRGAELIQLALTLLVLAACIGALIAQTNNPFIYFRF